ncbi:MAG: glycosyltransferase [Bacteroidetes bacterium]|nr:glycosyltransferase [Bacteroidota bacterium]
MKLTIITINRNNASGLQKTIKSVFSQTSQEFEYIVIDGASTDGSKEIIEHFSSHHLTSSPSHFLRWISEPDNGIYNAMNKGIRMAKGEYVQFLNSGDILVANNVTEKMLRQLSIVNCQLSIIYGNMLKSLPKGILRDRGFAGRQPTLLDFYIGTLNHSPAYIQRSLFDKYGLYDEQLKIVSDWKWYLQAIIFGGEQIAYVNIDVTLFDMNGISTINVAQDRSERQQVLQSLLPTTILEDYEKHAFSIEQMQRIKRYTFANKLVWWIERGLFKWETWKHIR